MVKNKFNAIALKVIFLWPLGAILAMFLLGFKGDFLWVIVVGLAIAMGYVFWNVFEYDKYDEMESEDYLEAKHSLKLPNSKAMLEMIHNQTKGAFADVILTDKKDEKGYWLYDIRNARHGSYLKVDFSKEYILLTIKPKYLKFIPDFATNYRIIHRLKRAANRLSSNP